MVRSYQEDDAVAVEALMEAAWPGDPTLREISAVHGPDVEGEARWRKTLIYAREEWVLGAATMLASARHPSRYFVVVVVAPDVRRRGVGSALLAECVKLGDGRPLLARVRENDPAGVGFLRAHGFNILMRNRIGVVDPNDDRVQGWMAETPSARIETGVSRDELARAHEEAYAAEHASWAPMTERPLQESLRLFCGESWLAQTARVVRGEGRIVAVAGLHGPPLAPSMTELFLIAGSSIGDEAALRALVAAELGVALSLGATVSIEADDANPQLAEILDELPAAMEPTLLLLSTDAQPSGR